MLAVTLSALFFSPALSAQDALRREIAGIAAEAQGKVSVACSLGGFALNCDLNPHAHPPMQSVFKAPLALAMLHLIERGKLSLDQPIRFRASDRIPGAYSPLQDQYPSVPLRRLLSMAVSLSDNVAFEPSGAVEFLRLLNDHPPLTAEHAGLLLGWMRDTTRANQRIKGRLPAGTVVMHKAGTSDTGHGLTPATNDIGLITLPDGRRLAIAIFVTDSSADEVQRDSVIARIAKAAYDAAVNIDQDKH